MTRHRKILCCLTTSDATAMFAKGHIQHPMHTVFDPPLPTHRTCETPRAWRATQQVVGGFLARLTIDAAFPPDHADTTDIAPGTLGVEILQIARLGDQPVVTRFNPPVAGFHTARMLVGDLLPLVGC